MTLRARATIVPRPTPGKTKTLLPWPIRGGSRLGGWRRISIVKIAQHRRKLTGIDACVEIVLVECLAIVEIESYSPRYFGFLKMHGEYWAPLRDCEIQFAAAVFRRDRIGRDEIDKPSAAFYVLRDVVRPLVPGMDPGGVKPDIHATVLKPADFRKDDRRVVMRIADEGVCAIAFVGWQRIGHAALHIRSRRV